MMIANLDAYRLIRGGSSRMKARASGLLAEGGLENRFQAAVLLHQAALQDERALEALTEVPEEGRVAILAEVCGCFLTGLDPYTASLYWGKVVQAFEAARPGEDPVAAYRTLKGRLDAAVAEYRRLLEDLPGAIRRATQVGGFAGLSAAGRRSLLGWLLKKALPRFTGMGGLWYAAAATASYAGMADAAWGYSGRASALPPTDDGFPILRLNLVAEGLGPADEARAVLDKVYQGRQSASAEALLMYALAELQRFGEQPADLRKARDAVLTALAKPHSDMVRRGLEATAALIELRLQGRAPDPLVLDRVGLAHLAAPDTDPLQAVAHRFRMETARSSEGFALAM